MSVLLNIKSYCWTSLALNIGTEWQSQKLLLTFDQNNQHILHLISAHVVVLLMQNKSNLLVCTVSKKMQCIYTHFFIRLVFLSFILAAYSQSFPNDEIIQTNFLANQSHSIVKLVEGFERQLIYFENGILLSKLFWPTMRKKN